MSALVVAVISDAIAAVLSAPDPPRAEKLLSDPDSLDKMTPDRAKPPAKRKCPERERKKRAPQPDGAAMPWEGPRIRFDLFLGEDAIWAGPASLTVSFDGGLTWHCRFCGSIRKLHENTCCLACCRTGLDDTIGRPTELDLRKRPPERRSYQPHSLLGGRS